MKKRKVQEKSDEEDKKNKKGFDKDLE